MLSDQLIYLSSGRIVPVANEESFFAGSFEGKTKTILSPSACQVLVQKCPGNGQGDNGEEANEGRKEEKGNKKCLDNDGGQKNKRIQRWEKRMWQIGFRIDKGKEKSFTGQQRENLSRAFFALLRRRRRRRRMRYIAAKVEQETNESNGSLRFRFLSLVEFGGGGLFWTISRPHNLSLSLQLSRSGSPD